MSDLGQFQGQWLGKWHGGVNELSPGFAAGNASFSINAIGTLTVVGDENAVNPAGSKRHEITYEQAKREWDAKAKWRDESARWADVTPMELQEVAQSESPQEPIKLDAIVERLDAPLLTLAELLADAKLLQLDQAQALEAAMAVRDVIRMAELAYLTELALQQEKDAIAAFMFFMDA